MQIINQDFTDVLRVEGINAQGYGIIAKLAMRDRRLTPEAKAIYGYICSFAGAGSTAFPGSELMQNELCMGENRFLKHRKLLLQYGYISIKQEKEDGKFKKNIYTIMSNPIPIIPAQAPSIQNEGTVKSESPSLQIAGTENAGTENEGVIINSLINNSFNKSTTTTTEGEAISDIYTKVTKQLQMNGLMSEYICKLKERGCSDEFIKEVLYETGESGSKFSLNFFKTIAERWLADGISSRAEARRKHEDKPASRRTNSKTADTKPKRTPAQIARDREIAQNRWIAEGNDPNDFRFNPTA